LACLASACLAEVDRPAKPEGWCATDFDGFYYLSDADGNETCADTWRAWDNWCYDQWGEDFNDCLEANETWNAANSSDEYDEWFIDWYAMRKTSAAKKQNNNNMSTM